MILDYKNSNIHYTVCGQGSCIVLLHGFLETVEMWDQLIPDLSKSHQVICIDLLGHGKTDCLGYVHTMEQMADAVLAVLESLNVENAHFIGHSMGGYVALALAEIKPTLFNALCLMNSAFEADDEARKKMRTHACKIAQQNFEVLVKMSFSNLFTPESKAKYKVAYEKALQLALQISLQGYMAAQEGMKLRPNRFEIFKNLRCKKLIIIGKKDTLINKDQLILDIKETDIDFVAFSEGHMSYIENTKELTYKLMRFIEN